MNSKLPKPNTTNSELDEILEGFENDRRWDSLGEPANEGVSFLTFDEAKTRLEALISNREKLAEGRGRTDVLSAMKDWSDGVEKNYNKFFEAELSKVKQLRKELDGGSDE